MSTERQITIRMPKASLDKWLAALRSGTYRQGIGVLFGNGTYCCLGVLQDTLCGSVEGDRQFELPPADWLIERGITFLNRSGYDDRSPWLPTLEESAHDANDNGRPFAEIADAIEACSEGV